MDLSRFSEPHRDLARAVLQACEQSGVKIGGSSLRSNLINLVLWTLRPEHRHLEVMLVLEGEQVEVVSNTDQVWMSAAAPDQIAGEALRQFHATAARS